MASHRSVATAASTSSRPTCRARSRSLGRGRNAQDPYRGLITDEGNVDIPLDVQGTGWWLTGLFGAPTTGAAVKATGSITFSGQPGVNSTITLNGVTWTFVTGSPTGNQTQIGVGLDATLTALATDLNTSADVEIAKCTYRRRRRDRLPAGQGVHVRWRHRDQGDQEAGRRN